jgi:hypothetical protein
VWAAESHLSLLLLLLENELWLNSDNAAQEKIIAWKKLRRTGRKLGNQASKTELEHGTKLRSCGFKNHANVEPAGENKNNYFLEPIKAIPETINKTITFAAVDFP